MSSESMQFRIESYKSKCELEVSFSSAVHSSTFTSTCRTLEKPNRYSLYKYFNDFTTSLPRTLNISSWSNTPTSSLLLTSPLLSQPWPLLSHTSSLGRLSKSLCLDQHRHDKLTRTTGTLTPANPCGR